MEDFVNLINKYKGYEIMDLTTDQITDILTGASKPVFFENQYVVLRDIDNGNIVDIRRYSSGEYLPIKTFEIDTVHFGKIKPRNLQQRMAFDLLGTKEIPLKFLTGNYGSGKSFLALNFAISLLEKNKVDKIVFARNNIAVKGTESIGHLPGTEQDKMMPWVSPLIDILGDYEAIWQLMENNQLEVVPLAFIRGRSFQNSIIIADECENLSPSLFQLIIGRIGEGSEVWFLGDTRQSDFGSGKWKQFRDGTMAVIDRLKGQKMVGVMDLPKTERSSLAALSNLLDGLE